MTISTPHDVAPSTLEDIIDRVKSMFSLVGSKVPISIGEFYETANQGNPPRIVFVPEGDGSLGDAITMGHAASWAHACTVIVRAKPGIGEGKRFSHATDLAGKVIAALAVVASGRISWGGVTRDNMTTDDRLGGVGVRFSFTYQRDIPHWADIWTLPVGEDPIDKPMLRPLDLAEYTPAGAGETPALDVADGALIVPTVTVTEDS